MNYLFWVIGVVAVIFFVLFAMEIIFKIKHKERIKNLEDHQRFFNKQHKKWWEK